MFLEGTMDSIIILLYVYIKKVLYITNATIWFNKMCGTKEINVQIYPHSEKENL